MFFIVYFLHPHIQIDCSNRIIDFLKGSDREEDILQRDVEETDLMVGEG